MQPLKNIPSERRRYPRITTSIPMNLVADKRTVKAVTVDLSKSGVCCRVGRPIAVMTRLEIILMLPDEGAPDDVTYVECEGIVVRNEETENGHLVAVFFSEIGRHEVRKLAAYIAARS